MDPRLTGLDLKTSLSALADLVLPRVCVVCGRTLLRQESHICMNCLADFPETHFASISHNPMAEKFNVRIMPETYEPYAYAAALFHYDGGTGYSAITMSLKYRRNFSAGQYFARMLGRRLAGSPLFADVDMVIPVPLHFSRLVSRGYNQAAVIARCVAEELGAVSSRRVICREDVLRRVRKTESQARISGVQEKAGNVKGAFGLTKYAARRLQGVRHVLLIDDVFTTGSTLAECHRALRALLPPRVRISAATLAFAGW